MHLSERLLIGHILIAEFEKLANNIDPHDDEMNEVINRANYSLMKMKMFHKKMGEPPEMVQQIEYMATVIKKLEQKQNKHVTDV